MKLRRRTSAGSMPSSSAISSISRSSRASPRPAGAAVGVGGRRVRERLVDRDRDVRDRVRARHHEQRQVRDRRRQQLQVGAVVLHGVELQGERPCPVVDAASYDCHWSRPWIVATMFSVRSSTHLTGAPTAFEAAQRRNSSR
jgi:hypothetical protein